MKELSEGMQVRFREHPGPAALRPSTDTDLVGRDRLRDEFPHHGSGDTGETAGSPSSGRILTSLLSPRAGDISGRNGKQLGRKHSPLVNLGGHPPD